MELPDRGLAVLLYRSHPRLGYLVVIQALRRTLIFTLAFCVAVPVLAADPETIWLDKLDAWVRAGGKAETVQDDVVANCGKLLYFDQGIQNALTMSKEQKDDIDFRIDVCTKLTVDRVYPQPEFEKPEIRKMVCGDLPTKHPAFEKLCARAKMNAAEAAPAPLPIAVPQPTPAAAASTGKPIGLVQPIKPDQFLAAPEDLQAIYVAGIMEGMGYATYGYTTDRYQVWAKCATRETLGDTAKEVVATLKAQRAEAEGVAYALAKTLGNRCPDLKGVE